MESVVKVVPQAKLILVGEGSQRSILEEQIARLNLKAHVTLAGHQTAIVPYLAACDVFVLASLNEGMGRAVLEAMACEKPVVVSNSGGLPEIVDDGVQGFVVDKGRADVLAQAMLRLAQDASLRLEMGRRARAKATEEFSVQTMVAKIDCLYREIM